MVASSRLTEGSPDLAAFHVGDRDALAQCYRDHYDRVFAAAARVVARVDAETVTHEVFHRLLSRQAMRTKFVGGDLGAWLGRVATNQAIDHRRRYAREESLSARAPALTATDPFDDPPTRLAAKRVIERFRRERLPAKWARVFEVRFLGQLGQREAARALGMSRTTLMYQEHRIRALLRRYVLEDDA